MKQRDVNFNIVSFLTKEEYEKAGCPIQYFEFREQDYYGLVAVKTDLASLDKVEKNKSKSRSQQSV